MSGSHFVPPSSRWPIAALTPIYLPAIGAGNEPDYVRVALTSGLAMLTLL